MLKTWILRIVLGLIVILIALSITAPADVIESQLQSKIPNVSINETKGSFWSGEFEGINYKKHSVANMKWQLSASSLLTAGIGAKLTINDPKFQGEFFVRQSLFGTTSLEDINGRQDLIELFNLSPLLKLVDPFGEIKWQDVNLQFNNTGFQDASGQIQWKDARLAYNGQQFNLGTISVHPQAIDNALHLLIESDDTLNLEGALVINRDKTYQLDILISEDLPPQIYNTLRFFARSNGKGKLTFSKKGRLK